MIALAATPVVIGLLLYRFADPLARRLRPAVAAPLLTGLTLTVALCTGLVLSAGAVVAAAQLGPLPRLGQWSAAALRARSGLPVLFGLLALAVVAVCLSAAVVRAVRSVRALVVAGRAAGAFRPVAGDLVLIEDEIPTAYSVAGIRGRIVVSTSMLDALSAPEQRVVIAHEAAHLRHRHHLYVHLGWLAAAANPLLRPCARAIAASIERWADEEAAAEVGDRRLAARALAHAALARGASRPPVVALGAADDRVLERVQLLLASPAVTRPAPVALVVVAVTVSWVAAVATTVWTNNIVQLAEQVYSRH
jgi:beta-lactamase regulating signal transducer with metallopeptidase domain